MVSNSTLYNSYLVTFVEIDTDLTVYANESNRLTFTALSIINSNFIVSSDVSIIDVLGCQVIVNSLSITGSLINGTKLTNTQLVSGSYLVGYLLDKTLYRILESDFTVLTANQMKVEFRPFMLFGCNFTNITLVDSTLFASNNPMIIVYQNNFNNIVLNSSILANFQKYSPPVPLPDNFNFVMNPISKVQIFKGYNSVFQVLFDMTVLKITPFQPQGITFFLDFENNTLLDISSNNGTVL
eukprot:CAMPEP_0176458136 /NCGR_PEP_ID=MMETSP0127-20121128/32403_1 /TAXON_ID=938130 /ORGANISM="Platyophrya macrostoma, Strain WH" /LENGTH=239 /DNA_ID=CAMNT_0017848627 /DNA_START=593 /DNA_END=1308 /DNA_ORIENTATION=-